MIVSKFNKVDTKYKDNWPVVYLLNNKKDIYIGETTNLNRRIKQHKSKIEEYKLTSKSVIAEDTYNKSAILDIESKLIQYMSADDKFVVLNKNKGITNHNYYEREKYEDGFKLLWEELREIHFVKKSLKQIENSDLFKYSPYKSLSDDQYEITELILDDIKHNDKSVSFVTGRPGTGKSVVAMYLFKRLVDENPDLNIGYVVPMKSLRKTIKLVCKRISGLKTSMIYNPSQIAGSKDEYDILLVDEAHRLKQRRALTNFGNFDEMCRKTGGKNELDWITSKCDKIVLFYDGEQSVKQSDISFESFLELQSSGATTYDLTTQHRVFAGDRFIKYITNILDNNNPKFEVFDNYETYIINNFENFYDKVKVRETEYGLSRFVSGYSFEWKSKKDNSQFDIHLGSKKLKWNVVDENWINSPTAADEVGCIHTTQGYDLNYIGLIFGYEIDYDFNQDEIIVSKDKFSDAKSKQKLSENELKEYIVNIYKTLMVRGMRGIYIYVCNEGMKKYLSRYFEVK
ncbi:DUF2075 domain-containing protein [Mycoplasmatota bacterium WC44]